MKAHDPPRPSALEAARHSSSLSASELRIAEATAAIVLAKIEEHLRRPTWLTAQQVADHLQVRRETVYARAAELGGVRVGGAWRFDPSKLGTGSTNRGPEGRENGDGKPKSRRRAKRGSGASGDLLRVGAKRRGSKRGP